MLVITDYEGGLPPIDQQPVPCTGGADNTVAQAARCRATRPARVDAGATAHPAPVAVAAEPAILRLMRSIERILRLMRSIELAPPSEGGRAALRVPGGVEGRQHAGGTGTACSAGTLRRMTRGMPVKGLVLAGGTASRLLPLTIVTNKHLLPIYDRPMIYYPIETLAGMGIREVMVVVGGKSVGDVVELLGDGSHFGLDLTYRYQQGALGIAHAIGLARAVRRR